MIASQIGAWVAQALLNISLFCALVVGATWFTSLGRWVRYGWAVRRRLRVDRDFRRLWLRGFLK